PSTTATNYSSAPFAGVRRSGRAPFQRQKTRRWVRLGRDEENAWYNFGFGRESASPERRNSHRTGCAPLTHEGFFHLYRPCKGDQRGRAEWLNGFPQRRAELASTVASARARRPDAAVRGAAGDDGRRDLRRARRARVHVQARPARLREGA